MIYNIVGANIFQIFYETTVKLSYDFKNQLFYDLTIYSDCSPKIEVRQLSKSVRTSGSSFNIFRILCYTII